MFIFVVKSVTDWLTITTNLALFKKIPYFWQEILHIFINVIEITQQKFETKKCNTNFTIVSFSLKCQNLKKYFYPLILMMKCIFIILLYYYHQKYLSGYFSFHLSGNPSPYPTTSHIRILNQWFPCYHSALINLSEKFLYSELSFWDK